MIALVPRLALLALGLLASGLLTGFAQSVTLEVPWERSFPADGLNVLDLSTPNGSMAVEAWDRPEVAVRATLRAIAPSRAEAQALLDAIRVEFAQDGFVLRGGVELPRPPNASGGVDFTVQVPRALALELRTANGAVTVTGVGGPLTLNSSNGNLAAFNAPGPMTLETSNGTVQVTLPAGAGAQLDLTTANGQISVQGVGAGTSQVRTAFGGGGPQVLVRTGNGSIAVNQMP